jgi:hypothetical protein
MTIRPERSTLCGQATTREWRRKLLKSLKTDSSVGGSRFGKSASVYAREQSAQDEAGRLAGARRCVAVASHRRVEGSTRGDKTLRTRAW